MLRDRLALFLVVCVLTLCSCSKKPDLSHRLLTIAHEGQLVSLDPQAYDDDILFSVLGNIYEPLVKFDKSMGIVSCLAERWENPSDLNWRFYLRKNVRFHNGKPLTAADVVYTIRRGLSEQHTGLKPYLISVKEARVVDERTVEIITKRPYPVLMNVLIFIYILPAGENPEAEVVHPIGTGPYVFEREIEPHKLLLHANSDYWAGKPPIEKVQFVHYDSREEAVQRLLQGKVQLIRDFSESLIPQVVASKNSRYITHDGLGVAFLGFNLADTADQNPFARLEVRRAIDIALDRKELVMRAIDGKGNVATQLIPPFVFGFDPNYVAPGQRLQEAKQLLANAGYASGVSTHLYGRFEKGLQEIANQLRGVHVDAQVHIVPSMKDLYENADHHKFPLFAMAWACASGDGSDLLDSLVHSPDRQTGYGSSNMAGYSNPELDLILEKSAQTLDVKQRGALLQKAFAMVRADLPYIPLYSRFRHYGVSKDLSWEPRTDGRLYAAEAHWKQ